MISSTLPEQELVLKEEVVKVEQAVHLCNKQQLDEVDTNPTMQDFVMGK